MKRRRKSRESVRSKGGGKAHSIAARDRQTVRRLRATIKTKEAQISRLLAELKEGRALLVRM